MCISQNLKKKTLVLTTVGWCCQSLFGYLRNAVSRAYCTARKPRVSFLIGYKKMLVEGNLHCSVQPTMKGNSSCSAHQSQNIYLKSVRNLSCVLETARFDGKSHPQWMILCCLARFHEQGRFPFEWKLNRRNIAYATLECSDHGHKCHGLFQSCNRFCALLGGT